MNPDDRRRALDALHEARPAVGRMDVARTAEETASDILTGWDAVEAALRTLVGNTTLTGQSLIREARQRQLLQFDQANALAEFEAVRDRATRPSYRPTEADVNAARTAYLKLETSLAADGSSPQSAGSPYAPRSASAPAPAVVAPSVEPTPNESVTERPATGRRRHWLAMLLIVLVLAAGSGITWYALRSRGGASDTLTQGVAYYKAGQKEAAAGAFTKAVREDPKAALPHVYLARMARDVGNMTLANQELQLALQAEPDNAVALREMGSFLLAAGNYELARRFYVHALQSDSTDRAAMGWLGCALLRDNRIPEAQRWFERAGSGDWSRCTPVAPPGSVRPPR